MGSDCHHVHWLFIVYIYDTYACFVSGRLLLDLGLLGPGAVKMKSSEVLGPRILFSNQRWWFAVVLHFLSDHSGLMILDVVGTDVPCYMPTHWQHTTTVYCCLLLLMTVIVIVFFNILFTVRYFWWDIKNVFCFDRKPVESKPSFWCIIWMFWTIRMRGYMTASFLKLLNFDNSVWQVEAFGNDHKIS